MHHVFTKWIVTALAHLPVPAYQLAHRFQVHHWIPMIRLKLNHSQRFWYVAVRRPGDEPERASRGGLADVGHSSVAHVQQFWTHTCVTMGLTTSGSASRCVVSSLYSSESCV